MQALQISILIAIAVECYVVVDPTEIYDFVVVANYKLSILNSTISYCSYLIHLTIKI